MSSNGAQKVSRVATYIDTFRYIWIPLDISRYFWAPLDLSGQLVWVTLCHFVLAILFWLFYFGCFVLVILIIS